MVFNPKFLKVLRLMRLSRLLRLAKFTKLMENYEDTSIRDWLESTRVFMFGVFILWTTHILGPSFAYSLPMHSCHTRRDRVAAFD